MSTVHTKDLLTSPDPTVRVPVGSGRKPTYYNGVRRSSGTIEYGRRRVDSWLLRELESIRGLGDLTLRYRLDHGGTRARTTLALLVARFGDGSDEQVIRAAELIELEHLASVFHTDDVMDMPAQAAGLAAGLSQSNSVAILSGDMILARANRLATALGPPAIELITKMMERFIVGKLQTYADLDANEDAASRYLRMLFATTGNFFATEARMALIFSGTPAEFEEPIVTFAERVGVAFQLVEDELHTSSSVVSHAKRAGMEARQWAVAAVNAIEPLPACSATSALRDFAENVIQRRL